MDKVIGKSKEPMGWLHVETSTLQLDPSWTNWWDGERGRKRETKMRGKEGESFRETSSTLSLRFPVIGPAVFDGARRKVLPHNKRYE